jgi:hypothetical protein
MVGFKGLGRQNAQAQGVCAEADLVAIAVWASSRRSGATGEARGTGPQCQR